MLRILRGAGPEGLPTLEIAARMIEHSPGVTRLLDRLEARKLVRRVRCPEDRRQVLCHATEAARRLLAGLEGRWPMPAAGPSPPSTPRVPPSSSACSSGAGVLGFGRGAPPNREERTEEKEGDKR